ncbi:hypothetical protein PAHAL_8G062500 [Panicum hallii]|nr:hypothetical protein PAHAL_8G062500 [Panicum hallii]
MSAIWGTDKGVHNRISIPSHVYVTRLSGKFDSNGVKSLTVFTSDGTTYGPYGDAASGKDFDIPVVKSAIVAFFGRSGQVLHAVGAYVVPKSC